MRPFLLTEVFLKSRTGAELYRCDISSFGFFRIGRISTSAIVLVLLIISAISVVVNNNKFTFGCFVISLSLLVVALLLGTEFYFAYSSLTDILLVLVPVVFGAGLIIKSAFENGKKHFQQETK